MNNAQNAALVVDVDRKGGAATTIWALGLLVWGFIGLGAIPRVQARTSPVVLGARAGNPASQRVLGYWYLQGKNGFATNPKKALKWFRKSAKQGDRVAEYLLGAMYQNNWGGAGKNLGRAAKWYLRSAEQGYPPAQLAVASFYAEGDGGLPTNGHLALQWLRKSAAQQYPPAINALRSYLRKPGQTRVRPEATVARSASPAAPSKVPHAAASRAEPAGIADDQLLDQSLQSFWQVYFHDSNAKLVEFGTPALVQPVSFAGPP